MTEWNGRDARDFSDSSSGDSGRKTGRMIMTLRDADSAASMYGTMQTVAGIRLVGASREMASAELPVLGPDEGLLLQEIGVCVMGEVSDEQSGRLAAAATSGEANILAVEAEEIKVALSPYSFSRDYLDGVRAGINSILDHLIANGEGVTQVRPHDGEATRPTAPLQAPWGIGAIRALGSKLTGKGVKVAVLDTGFELNHPDFAGRDIHSKSFIAGQSAQDGNGHGTHCIGTACGPRNSPSGLAYGVAPGTSIYVGKVLSNQGSGADGGILAGINWAIENGCAVISMSLGARARPREPYSQAYAAAARAGLRRGSVIVAAAGNDGPQSGFVVSRPANSPGIYAVAAVGEDLSPATFSNVSSGVFGGEVDIAGPGVDVYSAWTMPTRYRTISGTSMATPHVAGVLALLAEAFPGLRGAHLAELLQEFSLRLDASSRRVGLGLVQAPS